jgi:hypothetical protein
MCLVAVTVELEQLVRVVLGIPEALRDLVEQVDDGLQQIQARVATVGASTGGHCHLNANTHHPILLNRRGGGLTPDALCCRIAVHDGGRARMIHACIR